MFEAKSIICIALWWIACHLLELHDIGLEKSTLCCIFVIVIAIELRWAGRRELPTTCYPIVIAFHVVVLLLHFMLLYCYRILCYGIVIAFHVIVLLLHLMLLYCYCILCYGIVIASHVIGLLLHGMLSDQIGVLRCAGRCVWSCWWRVPARSFATFCPPFVPSQTLPPHSEVIQRYFLPPKNFFLGSTIGWMVHTHFLHLPFQSSNDQNHVTLNLKSWMHQRLEGSHMQLSLV